MRLLVLQHCPVTPVGLVGERAVERSAEFVIFDGFIVLGGPMHAGDDEGSLLWRRSFL